MRCAKPQISNGQPDAWTDHFEKESSTRHSINIRVFFCIQADEDTPNGHSLVYPIFRKELNAALIPGIRTHRQLGIVHELEA